MANGHWDNELEFNCKPNCGNDSHEIKNLIAKILCMELEELRVYNLAMEIGERVWALIADWNYFQKDTVGKQLVRAADSVAANLSEGYGRYHYREKKNFGYYSRGSLYETKTWLTKAKNRKLINEKEFAELATQIAMTGKKLNNYIKSIGQISDPEPNNTPFS
jgi:four helix bundle protein